MRIVERPSEIRRWSLEQKCAGKTIGFVPTMGALHEGHASLMRAAAAENDVSVASIYVNPAQFAPNEDLDKYPRTFEADCELAEKLGQNVVYAPRNEDMYQEGYATYVDVERLTKGLCGASRPAHFRGVTTIVAKLLNAVLPDKAYFGQKDAQQCAVIKRMARDLDMGVEIVEMPIIREPDGLAMSSRNVHLNAEQRQRALCLSKSLFQAMDALESGERDVGRIVSIVREGMSAVDIDYVEVVDAYEITPLERIAGVVLLAVAARLGDVRLIDNIKFVVPE